MNDHKTEPDKKHKVDAETELTILRLVESEVEKRIKLHEKYYALIFVVITFFLMLFGWKIHEDM